MIENEYSEEIIGKAEETEQYQAMLLRYLDELTIIWENLQARALRNKNSEELVNALISKMVSILGHILPKLKSIGSKGEEILKEIKPFEKWMINIQQSKLTEEDRNRIPRLYFIIIRAYHLIGISNI